MAVADHYGMTAGELAAHCAAQLLRGDAGARGPSGVSIDSRTLAPGELFFGIAGSRADGGEHARAALEAGAWGVLLGAEQARALIAELAVDDRRWQAAAGSAAAPARGAPGGGGAGPVPIVLVAERPLAALQSLAGAWRAKLGARLFAITGSVGKTSTKEILAALLAQRWRVSASPANFNTEIGLPLSILRAPADSEAIVLELAMRGRGQIAELAAIARPDVGVILNVAPVHLELLGSVEAIAAAKGELAEAMPSGGAIVLPAEERLLDRHIPAGLRRLTFGAGGDVDFAEPGAVAVPGTAGDGPAVVRIAAAGRRLEIRPNFAERHNLNNLLAAVAACGAVGYEPRGELEVHFAPLRGELLPLPGGALLINDCYNANPLSMRAALSELALRQATRRIAVLGDMRELGADGERLHGELGPALDEAGVDLLIAVGELAGVIGDRAQAASIRCASAAEAAEELSARLRPGDVVLVKGSRALGLEEVATRLRAETAVS